MSDWTLSIKTHWPHDRFLLGTEYIAATEEYNYSTLCLYLFVVTLEFDWV